jgi:hypothetical protein
MRNRASVWALAACVFSASCTGGQTGEEGVTADSACDVERTTTSVDLGPESETFGAELAGSYSVPLFWTERDWLDYVEPSQAKETRLTLRLTRRKGHARARVPCRDAGAPPLDAGASPDSAVPDAAVPDAGPSSAPTSLEFAPVRVDVRTEDGRIRVAKDGWLAVSVGAGGASRDAVLVDSIDVGEITLGHGAWLNAQIDHEGDLYGHINLPHEHGSFYTPCGGRWQLPLSERPDDPRFAALPVPADALRRIDGQRFTLDWGGGHRIDLTAKVVSYPETACWNVHAFEWNDPTEGTCAAPAAVVLIDDAGKRVAAAETRLRWTQCSLQTDNGACQTYVIAGSGDVVAVPEDVPLDEPPPDLSFDDGGATIKRRSLALSGVPMFSAGATSKAFWGSYTISLPVMDGMLGTPTLDAELTGVDGGGESLLRGHSLP